MNAIAFDTLKFARRLKEAGFTEQQAEALADAEAEFIEQNLATKQDIADIKRDIADIKRDIKELEVTLRTEIKQLDATLRTEIKQLDATLHTEIKQLDATLRTEIKQLDSTLRTEIKQLDATLHTEIKQLEVKIEQVRSDLARDLKDLEYRMTIKLGTLMVVAVGAIATLVKLL